MIIGISGKIGSGKDEVGQIIQYLTTVNSLSYDEFKDQWIDSSDWEVKKFADELKDTICRWIGCTREQLEDREFKEKELGEEWWYYKVNWYAKDVYKEKLISYLNPDDEIYEDEKNQLIKPTPRMLLQLLGTEAGRQIIHPNIWVNTLFANYKERPITLPDETIFIEDEEKWFNDRTSNWIITDVRFPNEVKAIQDRGGIVIRLHRPDENGMPIKSGQHESEIALDNFEGFDFEIDNDDDIKGLITKVEMTLKHFKII